MPRRPRKKAVPVGKRPAPTAELRRALLRRSKAELVEVLLELAQADRAILRQLTARLYLPGKSRRAVCVQSQAADDCPFVNLGSVGDERHVHRVVVGGEQAAVSGEYREHTAIRGGEGQHQEAVARRRRIAPRQHHVQRAVQRRRAADGQLVRHADAGELDGERACGGLRVVAGDRQRGRPRAMTRNVRSLRLFTTSADCMHSV